MTEVVQQPEEVKQEEQPVYCICRGPEQGFMVFCDGCEEWFHGNCVGIKKRQADKLAKYLCPKCAPPPAVKDKPTTPDVATSKSRSGRSIKKKKWDENEFEYDFKKEEDDEYEEEEEEEEKPRKPAPKKQASFPTSPSLHSQPHAHSHSHLQHPHMQQHSLPHSPLQAQHLLQQQFHHQQQQQQQQQAQLPTFMNHNNHFAHPNQFNIVHPGMQMGNQLNINPTIQAINSINQFNSMQHPPTPIPPPPLSQPITTTPISPSNGNSNNNKRTLNSAQGPSPKPSPETKPKMVRRESFPPINKGTDNKKTVEQEKEMEESTRKKARNNLKESFGSEAIATAVEAEVFRLFPKSTSEEEKAGGRMREYNNKIRSVLFNLSKNPALKERIVSGGLSAERFVNMRPEEYANTELAEWRKAQEIKSLASVALQNEEEEIEAQAAKLEARVREMESAESKAASSTTESSTTSSESDTTKKSEADGADRTSDDEKGAKSEKESVDIDINIDSKINLASPLSLPVATNAPLPLPVPSNSTPTPSSTAIQSTSATLPPTANVPIWKGELDQIGVDVEKFGVRAYHLGGPHMTVLLSQITSIGARGKLDMAKLTDYLSNIDASPHRTRSLVVFEPSALQDDESYDMTWEYYHNHRSPVVVCSTSPEDLSTEDSASGKLEQIYILPTNPDDIHEVVFPPSMGIAASRKTNLRAAGQRLSTRSRILVGIVITRLPEAGGKSGSVSKPDTPTEEPPSPPSMSISPNNSPIRSSHPPQSPQPQLAQQVSPQQQQQSPRLHQQPQHPQQMLQQQQQQQQHHHQQQQQHQHHQQQYMQQQQGFQPHFNQQQMYQHQHNMYPQQFQQQQQFHPQQQFQQQFNHPQQQFPQPHMFNPNNGNQFFPPQFHNNQQNNFQQQNFNKP